jgi:hypothetical protein
MRQTHSPQLRIDQTPIEEIQLDIHSRDDMVHILLGLQYIYSLTEIREQIFRYLEKMLPKKINSSLGRPGMLLWNILVLGVVRLGKNIDFDCLTDLANQHNALRQMLGHGGCFDKEHRYALQTVNDNLKWFTPEILDGINLLSVKAGHEFARMDNKPLTAHVDSFVGKTSIEYPTDTRLLWDAVRCLIRTCSYASDTLGISGWRQHDHQTKQIKILFRATQNIKRSKAKAPKKVEKREQAIKDINQAYLDRCCSILEKSEQFLSTFPENDLSACFYAEKIKGYQVHMKRQIDQIERRVINGEVIPHSEKVFSIFQDHSEWVSKGKAGVPVEFGLRVAIMTDQRGFILHHQVMENQTDDKVAVSMVTDAQKKFPSIVQASYDKGFYSVDNRIKLQEHLDLVVMPKKGKLSKADAEKEKSPEFVKARHHHSSVESSINALLHSGLDLCRDHGIDGFKRYVALGVFARNIKILGSMILSKKQEEAKKKKETVLQLLAA